ncbi:MULTISPECIES: GNAT family N-acetyltransferase [unclassified Shewanella]|uniref:GNAT family N-acetyltransferase n=1 Tax=unclassified Shewanella TaxID=196818 RepID=UPI001BB911A1|nr:MULTISPECIES: GNAT family N-acetyltransferase [unclassified Shewanella]GIU08271.1 N-acetyltransferase GCN5 [Shewanella sp. MBTL60-112-B1]GIU35163.1 N-acetyltransferase GCN5 [Shewanella sp. MBTL60-112-B2]
MLELYTDRLRLRTVSPGDWDNFLYTHSSEELNEYVRKPQAEAVIRQKFERVLKNQEFAEGEWLLTIIEDAHTQDFIGFVGLQNSDTEMQQMQVGYMIHPKAHGQGFASESLKAIIDWACLSNKPHKFIAYCIAQNIASAKVLEKCGFVREGILKENCKIGEQWFDDYLYGLLAAQRC